MKKGISAAILLILFFWGFWLHFYQLESWPEEERMICVHIDGYVIHPGVYTLPQSARLADLLEEAGGLREDACASSLNLAKRLLDGEKIYIYPKAEDGQEREGVSPRLPTDEESWLDVPGIGPVTAKKIVEYIRLHPSALLDDLIEVSGIGPAKLDLIKEYFEQ